MFTLSLGCHNRQAGAGPLVSDQDQQQIDATAPPRVDKYSYDIINIYPHDPAAFTQGLLYHDGVLYESTGLNGQSSLRKVEIQTGRVLNRIDVPAQYFAEGLAMFGGQLFQLTWQTQIGFVYDPGSLQMVKSFNYIGEGWGLTNDGQSLIMSNGTNLISYLDPRTFEVRRVLAVNDESRPIANINELEYVKGQIFANIWQTERIARIDPQSGRLTGWIYLTGLLPAEDKIRPVDVLNGIAYDEANDRLFVTGKLWPKLFEIKLKLRRTNISR
jgi:glutamine cyclotransferase